MPLQHPEAVMATSGSDLNEIADVSAGELCVREAEAVSGASKQAMELSLAGRDALCGFLAARTEGFSGADLRNLVREAAMLALRLSDMRATHVSVAHLVRATRGTAPTLKGVRIRRPYDSDLVPVVDLSSASFTFKT
jgi:SpoVK/Ycf46/Vps4 family AAA+-type ATPase